VRPHSAGVTVLTEMQVWRRPKHPRFDGKRGKLTPAQGANVRVAITYVAVRYRTPKAFARALGLTVGAMWKLRGPSRIPSLRTAFVVAELAVVGVDDVLTGKWPGGRCPHCEGTGRRA